MNRTRTSLFVLALTGLLLTACGSPAPTPVPTPVPVPTETPFPMAGCNAIMDDGVLWFDEGHEGEPFVITEGNAYVASLEFFAYYRAECIQNHPRVVMAIGDVKCVDQQIQWEVDGGWSCWMQDGSWTFVAGGAYVWPRGKPQGYEDPRPIVPQIPLPEQPAENNEQHG